MTVSASRKKLSSKVTVSIREKNPSPIARMKDSFKDTFPLDRKEASPAGVYEKLYKPESSFPLPGMKHSLKNTFLRYGKTASSGKKIKENSFH